MNDYIIEEDPLKLSMDSYEQSDVILTAFFAILDSCFIFYLVCYLKSANKKIIRLKNILFKLFFIDIIIRLLYTKKYSSWTFYKELFFTFMSTFQFYLIMSFINLALKNKKKENNDSFALWYCNVFFFLTFSYESIFFFNSTNEFKVILKKIILLMKSFGGLYCIYKFYERFCNNITEIANKLKGKKEKNEKLNLFILGSPQSCLFLFTFYYILKLIIVFIKNPITLIYINIIINIVKEASIIFLFIICQVILYQLYKIKVEDDQSKKKFSQTEENSKLTK